LRLTIGALLERAKSLGLTARPTIGRGRASRRERPKSQVLLDESFLHRLERVNLIARRGARANTVGEHQSRRRAASIEFADYRRYVSGDDLRRIDWNVYGRLNSLFLKLTEAKEDVAVHLLLDTSQSMDWGNPSKLLYARQLVAALGYLALARFDAVTVATFSDQLHERFPLARGKNQALALLGFLNDIAVGGQTDLDASLATYTSTRLEPGIAVVVSDLLCDDGQHTAIARLLRAGLDVTVIHLVHAEERHPTVGGELELVDSESGEIVEITVGQEAIRGYRERFDEWSETLRRSLAAMSTSYVLVDTSIPLESLLLHELRQRRLVR
jgi:uncharacterized protein (DUF58 family)